MKVLPSITPELTDWINKQPMFFNAAAALDCAHLDMWSGAGHDSCFVSRVAPTSMIFVPCAAGLSHNEAESAKPEDLAAGADVLLHAMLSRAGQAS